MNEKEKFEDTKGAITSRKWKDRQCNGQKNRTNNDIQNITQKTKDGAPLTSLKNRGWTRVLRNNNSFWTTTCGTCHVTLVTNLVISHQ